MRRILFVLVLCLLSAVPVLGQDYSGETKIIYYEDIHPTQLDRLLWWENICLERVIQLNPNLDITDVPYGQAIVVPADELCYWHALESSWGWGPSRLKFYEDGTWLDVPYYSSDVAYIRDISINEMAQRYTLCENDILANNILLHNYEQYATFADFTTMDIFIPTGESSCEPPFSHIATENVTLPTKRLDTLPRYFAKIQNICHEVIQGPYEHDGTITARVPKNPQPCYNEEGHRLRYFDDTGQRLNTPFYSDMPVYWAQPGETIKDIAEKHNVCLVNLLRVNGFPDLPKEVETEVFLPTEKACSNLLYASETKFKSTIKLAVNTNKCLDAIERLNPHLLKQRYPSYSDEMVWVILSVHSPPCYERYVAQEGESLYDIELMLNICHEAFTVDGSVNYMQIRRETVIHYPIDTPPCYDETGRRLYYPTPEYTYRENHNTETSIPYYTDMQRYTLERGDTAYSISQKFNVCVHDLLATNEDLYEWMYPGLRIFIPDTRPCYDQTTGMPLIYEGKTGELLENPQVGKRLIHYGYDYPIERTARMYNVCLNRIHDVNQAKLDDELQYVGWIIPTDRPPCYDDDGNMIHYVCYTEPIDISADYRDSDKEIVFHEDGIDCYDLSQPETVVWYKNQPYRAIYYKNTLFRSRAFTAWCYGVSLDDINAINLEEDIWDLLPRHVRLIPQPTRECYLDNPDSFDGQTVHRVYADETLSSIADIYGVPYQLIGIANGLDADYTIWAGQDLIIPTVFSWRNLIVLSGSVTGVLVGFILLIRRKRRGGVKKKKHMTD